MKKKRIQPNEEELDFTDSEEEAGPEIEPETEQETEKEIRTAKKRGMTLKTVPISMKRIRKVIDDLREGIDDEEIVLTSDDKFDLRMILMYSEWLKDTISGIINS